MYKIRIKTMNANKHCTFDLITMLGLFLIPLFISCVLAYDGVPQLYYDLEQAEEYFSWFMKTHNKTYYNKNEEKLRFEIFKHNLGQINEKNAAHGYVVFGVNPFTDITSEELIRGHTGFKSSSVVKEGSFCTIIDEDDVRLSELPCEFDWRTKNMVTPVKNQLHCGSCWAFAAIGNIESANAIKTGKLFNLSEQQLVDCDDLDGSCCGGLPEKAFQYLTGVGVTTSKDYPYVGKQYECGNQEKPRVLLDGCLSYDFTDEEKLKQVLVEKGPAAISIDATEFHLHKADVDGIITKCDVVNGINHAVLLVGYGEDNGVPYWIIKNSWGTIWGDKGYAKVKRGINACGMLNSFVNYAVIA